MPIKSIVILTPIVFALSGYLANNAQRAAAVAVGGAVIADVTGGSALTGAVVVGAAGYFCNDLNVPGCRNK